MSHLESVNGFERGNLNLISTKDSYSDGPIFHVLHAVQVRSSIVEILYHRAQDIGKSIAPSCVLPSWYWTCGRGKGQNRKFQHRK